MKKPEALLFDLGDTLMHLENFDASLGITRVLNLAENKEKPEISEVMAFIAHFQKFFGVGREMDLVECPIQKLQKMVFDYFRLSFSHSMQELEWELWEGAAVARPQEGIVEVLEYLKKQEIPLGIVSNSAFSHETLQRDLQKHKMDHFFNFLISSAEYGLRKPHPALFLVAAAKLVKEPEYIWFVGDSLQCDVLGSQKVGMVPIWYNQADRQRGSEDLRPAGEFKAWVNFIPLFEGI